MLSQIREQLLSTISERHGDDYAVYPSGDRLDVTYVIDGRHTQDLKRTYANGVGAMTFYFLIGAAGLFIRSQQPSELLEWLLVLWIVLLTGLTFFLRAWFARYLARRAKSIIPRRAIPKPIVKLGLMAGALGVALGGRVIEDGIALNHMFDLAAAVVGIAFMCWSVIAILRWKLKRE
jgi:hypothetical protein